MTRLGWRNLTQSKTRLLISVGGVALSLMLILSLDAVLAGMERQISAYIEQSGADIWVAQSGVRNLHMVTSSLPGSVVEQIRAVPGVAEVSPLLYVTYPVVAGGRGRIAYVMGIPGGAAMGGPRQVFSGRRLPAPGQVVLDRSMADFLGVDLGGTVRIFGRRFQVAGLTEGTSSIGSTLAFIAYADFALLRRSGDTVSFVLVKTRPGRAPEVVARAIEARASAVTALPRTTFAVEERRLVKDMGADAVTIMNTVGFLIGLAAMALTTYTAALSRRAEYGVLKALGAEARRLYGTVLAQSLISVALGFTVALAATWVLAVILPVTPVRLVLEISAGALLKTAAVAMAMTGLAAVLPIWQIAGLDPALVYRGAGR